MTDLAKYIDVDILELNGVSVKDDLFMFINCKYGEGREEVVDYTKTNVLFR